MMVEIVEWHGVQSRGSVADDQCRDCGLAAESDVTLLSACGQDESKSSTACTSCVDTSCNVTDQVTSSLPLPLMTNSSEEQKRDLPLLSLPTCFPSLSPFSPQTPCSQFESCVLQLNAVDRTCIAGAVLCRWDNIVGPRIMYVWSTTVEQRSWLAAKNILGYIARCTLGGEVNRNPYNEVKFFTSSDSAVALATIVFSYDDAKNVPLSSPDVTVYSLSVIVPYSELTTFLGLKLICLEWLSRAVLQLRVLLSQDIDRSCDWFQRSFTDFIYVADSLQRATVPQSVHLSNTALQSNLDFEPSFVRQAIAAHLYQCQQTVIIGRDVERINLMVGTLSLFTCPFLLNRCRYLINTGSINYSPELCVQGLFKMVDWQLDLVPSVFYSQYPTAVVDITDCTVWVLCPPHEFSARKHNIISHDLRLLWLNKTESPSPTHLELFEAASFRQSLVDSCMEQLELLPLNDAVREAYIHMFMTSLRRRAMAVIHCVATDTDYGKRTVKRSSLLSKLRKVFSLDLEGDLMAVLGAAERLKPGILDYVCGSSQLV